MQQSIVQTEESIQDALESLRSIPLSQQLSDVLDILAPKGYHPVVELQEDGRKKRRTASIENWTPETGEILISFSKDTRQDSTQKPQTAGPALGNSSVAGHRTTASPSKQSPLREVKELCDALEEVERQGRSFVALKWFRDEVLPAKGFPWAAVTEERHAVLAQAVESGAIVTSKIPNPRSPFPTTTIRLNRSRIASQGGTRRFSPVRIQGEPLSTTILRDRGVR